MTFTFHSIQYIEYVVTVGKRFVSEFGHSVVFTALDATPAFTVP